MWLSWTRKDSVGNSSATFVIRVHPRVRLTVVFAFLSSSFSGTSCGPCLCLTRILRLLRLPFPLNPHHQRSQHHHCHDYQWSSSAKYLTKIFRRRCLALFPSHLWRSATHKLLSHFSIFSSLSLFCMFMSTFLFLYTRILRVQIFLFLSFCIFCH